MTSLRGCGRPRWEHPSVAPSVALFIAPPDSSPPPKSGDKLSDQPARPSEAKPLANAPAAATNIFKYSEDDLQRIFKAVLEAQALILVFASAPASVLALVVSKMPRKKLKTCSPDVYCRKSHIDCYKFCQQCENYFATAGATGPTQIPFIASFLWDWINFRWQ